MDIFMELELKNNMVVMHILLPKGHDHNYIYRYVYYTSTHLYIHTSISSGNITC